jgi:hypothetical protein
MEVEICDIVRRIHANSPERRAFCPRCAVRHDASAAPAVEYFDGRDIPTDGAAAKKQSVAVE